MPTYEYACQKCGRQHEVVQKISDKPLTRCPSCKGKLTRLISATAFQLKGTGWYATDYAKKGSAGESKEGEKKEPEKKDGEKAPDKKESGAKPATATAKD